MMPSTMLKWLGSVAVSTSNSRTSGMTPSTGPNSEPAPPSKAMITTWNEIAGLNAMAGSI